MSVKLEVDVFDARRSSSVSSTVANKTAQQQSEDYRLDLFGRHIPRILVKQLIAKLVDQFIYQSSENDLDQMGAFSCMPSIGRFEAALLFVDISGFTVLSQRLPVDELRLCINNYFKIILDTIIANGGDVVKFAGDALFVIWQAEDGNDNSEKKESKKEDEIGAKEKGDYRFANLLSAVARAVKCGIEINRLCSNYRVDLKKKTNTNTDESISNLVLLPTGSDVPLPSEELKTNQADQEDFTFLNVHSGCACGMLAGIDVGAADRWEYVMIGEPLQDVADAESAAEKGEIVLSAYAHNIVCAGTYLHPNREEFSEEEKANADLSKAGDVLMPCGCSKTANGCYRLNQERAIFISDAPQVSDEEEDAELDQADYELMYYRQVVDFATKAFQTGKQLIMKKFVDYLLAGEGNHESESKKTLLTTSSLPTFPSSTSAPTTPSHSFSPQMEQYVFEYYIRWLLSCLLSDFARHVHEADRTDFVIAKINRLNCLEHCAKQFKSSMSQGLLPTWMPPEAGTPKTKEASESFVRRIRNLVTSTPVTASTSSSISTSTTSTSGNNGNNYLREKNQKKHERLLRKDRELNGELRNVIVMFIAIKSEPKSITFDPDDDEEFKRQECAFSAFQFVPRSRSERDADTKLKKHYQTCMSLIVTALKEKGGQLRQFIVDDKGTVAIGSFGLRGSTTYDNAASAVEAALNLIIHLQNVGLNAAIGITNGKAYCGVVGSLRRHEYAVMGPSVNLSARLMGKAKPGEIICDVTTRSVDRSHAYRMVGEVKAKGYADLVSIFKPVFNRGSVMMNFANRASFEHIENVPSQTPRRTTSEDESLALHPQGTRIAQTKRLIGRDSEEFEVLHSILSDIIDLTSFTLDLTELVNEIRQNEVISGKFASDSMLNTSCNSKMIVVHGMSGIGKSALLNCVNEKLVRYSKKASWNLQIVHGKSSSLTLSDPFKPWHVIIRTILNQFARYENIIKETREPELELSDRSLAVKRWLKGLDYLSAYLTEDEKNCFPVLSASHIIPGIEENDFTSKFSGQQKLELVIGLLKSIVRQYPILTNKVLLIVLDDSHFMDPHSWKLVQEILHSVKGVFFFASYFDAKENGNWLNQGDQPEAEAESKKASTPTASIKIPSTSDSNEATRQVHSAIMNLSACRRITLGGLDTSGIRSMAGHIFEGFDISNIDDSVFETLQEISGGNPLYIYEVGLACLEKMKSFAMESKCDLKGLFSNSPDGGKSLFARMMSEFRTNRIDEVIYYRFDRLDAQCQLILKMGSVITISNSHRGFNLEMLMHMLEKSSAPGQELTGLFACLNLKDRGTNHYLHAAEVLSKRLQEMVNNHSFIKIIRTRRRSSFNDNSEKQDEMLNEIMNLASRSFDLDADGSQKNNQSRDEYEERLRKEMVDICYDFNISLERKTIYDLMLDDQKESLHDRVANQLEKENEGASASHYLTFSDLNEEAFHWEKATVWGNAMSCYYRAGMLLDSLGAMQESYKYLGNAYRMLVFLRKDAKIKESVYHSIKFETLIKEFEFLNNTSNPYDGVTELTEDTVDRRLSSKSNLQSGDYSLTRIDIYNTFGGDANLLEVAINLLLRFGQASFTLGENVTVTSKVYEDALRLMLLTWPRKHDHKDDNRDFTDDVSHHQKRRQIVDGALAKLTEIQNQVDLFKLKDPSICFPLIAGMATLYRTRRLVDDAEHSKERALYSIMLNFAKTAPKFYQIHHLQAVCLMNSLHNEFGEYEEAMNCLKDIHNLYDINKYSTSLAKAYGNDRVPFTIANITELMLLLGYIPQAMVLREKLRNYWLPRLNHLHSLGTLALSLSAVNLLICHNDEAEQIFMHYRQTELSRPGAYSFFKDSNVIVEDYFQVKKLFFDNKFHALLGLFVQCDSGFSNPSMKLTSVESKTVTEQEKDHHSQITSESASFAHLQPIIQKIIDRTYLILENRPLLFDAILSFGIPIEFLCADILIMLTESLLKTNSDVFNPRSLLSLGLEYCEIAIDKTKVGHRFMFSYMVMMITKLRIHLHLAMCPLQLGTSYETSKEELFKHLTTMMDVVSSNGFAFVPILLLQILDYHQGEKIFSASEFRNLLKLPTAIVLDETKPLIPQINVYYMKELEQKNENFYADEGNYEFNLMFEQNSPLRQSNLIDTLKNDLHIIFDNGMNLHKYA